MTSKERVIKTLTFNKPDRIPRDMWELPGVKVYQPGAADRVRKKFEMDILSPPVKKTKLSHMKGEQFEPGLYVDEWRCEFENLQYGIVGEVKKPLVANWSDLDKVKAPWDLLGKGMEEAFEVCKTTDKFTLGLVSSIFERMQYIRGTENLFMDFATQPSELLELRDIVFKYHLSETEVWCKSEVDGIIFTDDWGSQISLLISPEMWRKLFKPLYKQFVQKVHDAGKFAFMHSDGYIFDIYEDLIDIGMDAINSQLFCMPIEEIGRRCTGKITFWGEIDRQQLLPYGSEKEIRDAVVRVWDNLSYNYGGVIAQLEYGLEAKFENVMTVYDEWLKVK